MIVLDTNVLVRLATADDPVQAGEAKTCLVKARTLGEEVFVPSGAVMECVWTLAKGYGFSAHDIAEFIERFADIDGVALEHEECVLAAARAYALRGDFPDLLFLELAKEKEATCLVTFDRTLQALSEGFAVAPAAYAGL